MLALVVDDSSTTRRYLVSYLRDAGFEVEEAANGADALQRLGGEAAVPSLVLVDWNMPELDGLGFVRAVRRDERFSKMAVLMVSAENEKSRLREALAAGADEYVMKPFDADALREKLLLMGFSGTERR